MLNLEEFCALRDKLIMDEDYSQKEKDYLFGLFQKELIKARTFNFV